MTTNGYAHNVLYWGTIQDTAFGQSKNGTPELVVRFTVDGQVDPKNPDGKLLPCPQSERTAYLYFSEKNIEYTMRDLELLGFDGDSFAQLDKDHPDHVSLVGHECAFLCRIETYENKPRERWSVSQPKGPAEASEPISEEGVRKMDAIFGKMLKKCQSKVRAKKAAKAQNSGGDQQEADTHQVADGVAF